MRYLGIDYGSKKIGLALSDEAGTMGFPREVIPNAGAAAEDRVCELIKDEKVGAVVIGESRDLSGAENPIAAAAAVFAKRIRERTGIRVHFEPETYTSAEARRQFETGEKTRAQKPRSPVDASAAALILTSYLSRPDHE